MSAVRRSKRRSRDSAIASGVLRQPPERVERLLEAGGRLAVGRAQEDLGAGLAQVAHRLVPDLALPRVVRQPLHVLDEAIGVQALDGGRHRGVKIAPALPQEARVGHVVGQRVLEGVLQIREELRLVEELRLLQMREPPPQGLLRLLRDRRQERVGHVLADHRGGLQEPLLLRRQPVDPRRQDRLHRRRHLQRLHRPRQPVRSALPRQRPRLHQGPHRLLQEERVAPLHQHLRQRRQPGVRAEERRQQLRRALGGQAVEPELGVGRLAPPAVLVLGAVVDQEQEAGGAQALHEAVEQGLGLAVDPVQVLEDHEQRLHLALAQQQALDRVERALAALGRVQVLPGRVLDRHVEQREQRGQQGLERAVQAQHAPQHLGAHLPVVVPVADLEVALEQVDHGQVAGGLAVGDGRGLQDQPVLHPMRVGELVGEPRLAHPGLAHDGDHLAVAGAGLAERPGAGARPRRRGRRSA